MKVWFKNFPKQAKWMKFVLVKNCVILFLPENINSDAPPWDIDLEHWFFIHEFYLCVHKFSIWVLIPFRKQTKNSAHLKLLKPHDAERHSLSSVGMYDRWINFRQETFHGRLCMNSEYFVQSGWNNYKDQTKVLEAGVSRNHVGPIECPPENRRLLQAYK